MRWVFGAVTAAYTGLMTAAARTLPERVPLHWGLSGVDRWGSRTQALVAFALVGGGMAVLFVGMNALTRLIPLSSPLTNLPHKEWWTATPEREARCRRVLSRGLWAMAAATMALLCVVLGLTMRAAHDEHARLPGGNWLIAGVLAAYGMGLTWSTVRLRRRLRPDAAPDWLPPRSADGAPSR